MSFPGWLISTVIHRRASWRLAGRAFLMKTIPLTQGKVALVDDDLYPYLMTIRWYAEKNGNGFYARANVSGKKIRMHEAILEAPQGWGRDHVDGNGLNNQRSNLRLCKQSQNISNSRFRRNNTSGFKGVFKSPKGCINPWISIIKKSGKCIHLGTFETKESAAMAYDSAALRLFGPFARTNAMLGLLS